MAKSADFKPVSTEPGRLMYQVVKDAVKASVDGGRFSPGQQLPSTKALSEQLRVSLVTVHRALQELVAGGVLRRGQGRGTFVHEEYLDRAGPSGGLRFGLVFHAECSLADSYHGLVLEGVRRGAAGVGADLVILQFGEDWRNECNGFLYVNPFEDQLDRSPRFAARRVAHGSANKPPPIIVVGASWERPNVWSVDTDNHDLARQAVRHLAEQGHTRIGVIAGGERTSNSVDRYHGYRAAMAELGLEVDESLVFRPAGWKLEEEELLNLMRVLRSEDRPTAIFAAGFSLALGLYGAARRLGLRIPEDLSVIGVDDAKAAAHLSPALTAIRQPLMDMGVLASRSLFDLVKLPNRTVGRTMLRATLINRGSTSRPGEPADVEPVAGIADTHATELPYDSDVLTK